MGLPKIGTAGSEKLGVATVSDIVFRARAKGGLGFVYRNQPEVDVGIDGHIEIVDQETTEVTGKLVGVQIKSGPSFFQNRGTSGWAVYIRKSTVHYWREYAVPVVLALVDTDRGEVYWVFVSEGAFEETEDSYKIIVREVQRLDAGAADAIEQMARQGPAALVAKLRALAAELSDATAAELERHRAAWREGRRADARAWLDSLLRAPAQLAAIDSAVAARVLRYAAATTLDEGGDIEAARAWSEEARRRDPTGDDVRLRAGLLARDGDTDSALELLASSPEPSAEIMRAGVLCGIGQRDAAAHLLDHITPTKDVDLADVWRLRARLRVAARDLPGALDAVARAEEHGPRYAQVRMLRGVLTYFEGLVPMALPEDLSRWPRPMAGEFLRRDADAVRAFSAAADTFRELLHLDWAPAERRQVEAWRLATLCAMPTGHALAATFAQEVLARDLAQPYVMLWAATERLPVDLAPHLEALATEVETTGDIGVALVYVAARAASGQHAGLGEWLDAWRGRFNDAGATEEWAFWRARAYVTAGDDVGARALLSDLDTVGARMLEAELLAAEANSTGDTMALAAHFEALAREAGDTQLLLRACSEHARADRWEAVVPHLDLLMSHLPTPPVHRLAIFALYNTRDFHRCAALLELALAQPGESMELLELRRIRADLRLRTGDFLGAIEDIQTVIAQPGHPPLTRDLLALARAHFLAGHTHELAACARQLRRHGDLEAADALMLCDVLVHDDPALARELWHLADKRGVADSNVPHAVSLGYQLGLDAVMGALYARMVELAATGAASVQQVTVDELIAMLPEQLAQQDRMLELYRRGETATHMVAQTLNQPLVHFYHVLPAANEEQSTLRHRFALQLRDGGRGVPTGSADLVAPGRLALDLSALLLAGHVGILPELEAHFAPLQLPHLAIAALREQRDRLKPHQPSRLELSRQLVAADRRGQVRPWDDNLPVLDPEERAAAGNWWEWVALLERARLEGAFVLDLPLGSESPHGRPKSVAGTARLERLLTISDLQRFLLEIGALGPNNPSVSLGEQFPAPDAERQEQELDSDDMDGKPAGASADVRSRSATLARGARVYLTSGGAEAVAAAGLLRAAAEVLTLLVDPSDLETRRAQLEALLAVEERVIWIEDLIRRVSDGLADGKYALLSPRDESAARQAKIDETRRTRRTAVRATDAAGGIAESSGTASTSSEPVAATSVPDTLETEADQRADDDGTLDGALPQHHSVYDEDEDRRDHHLSLALRSLTDLVSLPAGAIDAVWLEDRWINRHRFAGSARMTDLLEVLASLEAAGRITPARRWSVYLQLRSANVRILPFSTAEISYHLKAAPLTNGSVVETPALRIIRQYAAALLEDANTLRVSSADQLAKGDFGELEVVRGYTAAVREALVDIWRPVRGQTAASAQARAEAQSSWLIANLYLDLALLRARTLAPNTGPEAGVSAVDAASLLASAIQLLSSRDVLLGGREDALATAYARWVYDTTVAPRAARDAEFQAALVNHLRALFRQWAERDADDSVRGIVSLLLAGRTFDALPEALRNILAEDATFMALVGREIVSSLSVGRWQVPTAAFANAAAALLARGIRTDAADDRHDTAGVPVGSEASAEAPDGHAENGTAIPVLNSDPPLTLLLSRMGPDAFTLGSPDGREAIQVRDAAFGVLAANESDRRAACEALRPEVDIGVAEWRSIVDTILGLEDPAARLEALTQYRTHALRSRYAEMTARWAAEHRIGADDLRASPPETVLRHLRVNPDMRGPGDLCGGDVPGRHSEVWERAARALIDEEGIEAAFDRLAGLPVPMPAAVRLELEGMNQEARRAFVHRVLRTPTSPFGVAHTTRVLSWLGGTDPRYLRVARRLVRRLLTPGFHKQVTLLRLVATQANAALKSHADTAVAPNGTGRTDVETPTRAAERFIASWYHAHRFVAAVCSVGADPSGLVEWLEGRADQNTGGFFDLQEIALPDIAHPALLRPVPFVVAALQYASDGTSLLDRHDALLEERRSSFAHSVGDGLVPHIDLLRDLRGHSNVLGTWLQPGRAPDGSISVKALEVVPLSYAPEILRADALTGLERNASDREPWITLEIVTATDVLVGADAERFNDATAAVDIAELLIALGEAAGVAAARLARQAQGANDALRRARLREAFLAVEAAMREPDRQSAHTPPSARGNDELSELQVAVVQALYLLAHAEATPAAAMAAFAEDLAALSRTDAAYLRRIRGVLERVVLEHPLAEAHACTGLLLEARAL